MLCLNTRCPSLLLRPNLWFKVGIETINRRDANPPSPTPFPVYKFLGSPVHSLYLLISSILLRPTRLLGTREVSSVGVVTNPSDDSNLFRPSQNGLEGKKKKSSLRPLESKIHYDRINFHNQM